GVRITAGDGSIVHYRPSGNAPELRCYVEAADDAAAARLLKWGLTIASAEISREV
ncbi:MAG: phosphomannomutase, partial [Methylobacterium sp.]